MTVSEAMKEHNVNKMDLVSRNEMVHCNIDNIIQLNYYFRLKLEQERACTKVLGIILS